MTMVTGITVMTGDTQNDRDDQGYWDDQEDWGHGMTVVTWMIRMTQLGDWDDCADEDDQKNWMTRMMR